jgi:beta-glucosidase
MKRNRLSLYIFILSFLGIAMLQSCTDATTQSMKKEETPTKVKELLAKMTLQEKIGQLMQYTGAGELTGPLEGSYSRIDKIKAGMVGSMLNVNGAEYTRKLQKIAVEETRLGIPLLFGYDVIHGYKTIFPVPLAEAASWDLASIQRTAEIAADEASAAGQHWTFAPMVDIARDARWGRIMEGAGEDTYYGSLVAAARVHGFQGNDLSLNNTIIACAKHFVAYGAAQAGRDYYTTEVSERTLRQVYLPPFKAALDAGVETFMSAFNDLNGIPTSGNDFTTNQILEKEWNFQGFVVSDWGSIQQMIVHRYVKDLKDAAEISFNAGVHMDMENNAYSTYLEELIKEGKVSEKLVDDAARRILTVKYKLGLFDDPYKYCDTIREKNTLLKQDYLDYARKSARESFVLLKNNNQTLPISEKVKTIAVIGPLADNKNDMMGTWSARGDSNNVVTLLAGIKARAGSDVKVIYVRGCNINDNKKNDFDKAYNAAKNADFVILALGEEAMMTGEARSRMDINIPEVQRDLAKAVMKAQKTTALVLFNGRPLSLVWENENIPAILDAWLPGTMAGAAIADVLFGDYNPAGKLPVTFPYAVGQCPIFYNYKNSGRPRVETDRYTSKYIDGPNEPLFPFGFGLSYTTFEYSDLNLDNEKISKQDTLHISVTVKNTGELKGQEVVQLYINDLVASITPAVHQLRGFEKIELEPGASKTVTFKITDKDLEFVGKDMKWISEPGMFEVQINKLKTEFELK